MSKCLHRNSIAVDIDGAGEDFRFCNGCGENFTLSTPAALTARDIEQKILAFIESSIEDTRVPDAIAAHADKRAGKPVTKTDAMQIEAQVGLPVCLTRRHGMTQIAWAVGKGGNPWSEERSILIAHADTNVRWPSAAELRQKEPAYFGARDERNAARKLLLDDHRGQSQSMRTSAVTRAAEAIVKVREASAELEQLSDHGAPLNVVRYAIEKLTKEG